MLTNDEAREFAGHWISAWNAHDLAAILSHYSNEVVLTSPVAEDFVQRAHHIMIQTETTGVRASVLRGRHRCFMERQ